MDRPDIDHEPTGRSTTLTRNRISLAVIWLLTCLIVSSPITKAQDLIVTGGWVFDGLADEVRRNTAIVIKGGAFARIDVDPGPLEAAGGPVLGLGDDDYILPGFFDLHAHYNINVAGLGRIDETDHNSVIFLANGVTSTFPAGEYDPEAMLEMRRRIDRGEQIGPRVYNSGPYYGQHMPRGATAQDVIARVDAWAALGVRSLKAKRINTEQLEALIARGHRHGLTVTAHLDSGYRGTVNPKEAILMGIDRVEHFLGGDLLPPTRPAYESLADLTDAMLDTPAFDEIVNLFIERGVFFDATLTAYGYFGRRDEVYDKWHDESRYFTPFVREWAAEQPRRIMEQFEKIYHVKHKTLKRFYDAGGLITLGTDHVSTGEYLAGFAVHRELHALVRAGIEPSDALKIATIHGARALNVAEKLGTIEVGKFADLLVVKGNPLIDIRQTRTVHTVVKAGIIHDPAALLQSVEGKLGPSGPPP